MYASWSGSAAHQRAARDARGGSVVEYLPSMINYCRAALPTLGAPAPPPPPSSSSTELGAIQLGSGLVSSSRFGEDSGGSAMATGTGGNDVGSSSASASASASSSSSSGSSSGSGSGSGSVQTLASIYSMLDACENHLQQYVPPPPPLPYAYSLPPSTSTSTVNLVVGEGSGGSGSSSSSSPLDHQHALSSQQLSSDTQDGVPGND